MNIDTKHHKQVHREKQIRLQLQDLAAYLGESSVVPVNQNRVRMNLCGLNYDGGAKNKYS